MAANQAVTSTLSEYVVAYSQSMLNLNRNRWADVFRSSYSHTHTEYVNSALSNTVPLIQYTLPIINAMVAIADVCQMSLLALPFPLTSSILDQYYNGPGIYANGTSNTVIMEPFISTNIIKPMTDAALPHAIYSSPVLFYWSWPDVSAVSASIGLANDVAARKTIHAAGKTLSAAVVKDGQNVSQVTQYPNYSLIDTPAVDIWGQNLATLKALRKKYDPTNIMLRSSGFKPV